LAGGFLRNKSLQSELEILNASGVERFSMNLSGFAVTSSFSAWRPGDRDRPERQISISPGPKHVFTDEAEPSGIFVKFLRSGSWFEADRREFDRSTVPLGGHQEKAAVSAQRGA
jgi:hypothetical protein